MEKILNCAINPIAIKELMDVFNSKDRTKFRKKYFIPLIEEGLIQMTNPTKLNSPTQKYVITEKAILLLENLDT